MFCVGDFDWSKIYGCSNNDASDDLAAPQALSVYAEPAVDVFKVNDSTHVLRRVKAAVQVF